MFWASFPGPWKPPTFEGPSVFPLFFLRVCWVALFCRCSWFVLDVPGTWCVFLVSVFDYAWLFGGVVDLSGLVLSVSGFSSCFLDFQAMGRTGLNPNRKPDTSLVEGG